MSKRLNGLLLCGWLICGSGCYLTRVTAPGEEGATHSRTGVSLFWGITGTDHGAVECLHGLKQSTTYFPWWSSLVQGITAGIVAPIRQDYVCLAPTGAVVPMPLPVPPAPVSVR